LGQTGTDTHADLAGLIRQLAGQVDSDQQAPTAGGFGRERVILDLVVDNLRCVLIQRPAPSLLVPPAVTLSPREQEIARMVAKGYPNKTIAAVLDISAWTVSSHLRRIFAKLGVASRAAMVARLLEESGPSRSLKPQA
jgi:DNA-binding CsgD family transcriptional regulator